MVWDYKILNFMLGDYKILNFILWEVWILVIDSYLVAIVQDVVKKML